MPKNIELVQQLFGSQEPLPSIELADNALKLGGVPANLYALKTDLNGQVEILLGNIQDVIDDLEAHEEDDVRHLTQGQIDKIAAAINATQALQIANQAINNAKDAIIASAVSSATSQSKDYTDAEVDNLEVEINDKIGNMNLPVVVDPETGEEVPLDIGDTLVTQPQNIINPEYFYRFKNMIENSSFEVFNGMTGLPLGWDAGEVSPDAAMFGTYSLKLEAGTTAKQTNKFMAHRSWMIPNPYDATDCIFCFYLKYNPVKVQVYDVANEQYLTLTRLSEKLEEEESSSSIVFEETNNWSKTRCMVKFTPPSSADGLRIELTGRNGTYDATYIDAPMLEPYVEGEYPSIYKDGRYSVSAYQILNPPPADVDRFTDIGHFKVGNSVADVNGNITYQELLREDNSLAIKRQASNPDINGYYQTIVETFYKADGTTVNYADTWTYTYTDTGAILSASKTTTEVT